MRSTPRFALAAVAAAAIALAIVAVPVLLRQVLRPDEGPAPTAKPAPGITVRAGEISTAPQVGAPTRDAAVAEISQALKELYAQAFEQPQGTPGPDETPRPRPEVRVRTSMTTIARQALAASPGVFDEAADLSVYTATVSFHGVITFDGKTPVEALLGVDFGGEAVPVGARSPAAKVRQTGTLVLKATPDGWLVDGFDLQLATRPLLTSTPS
jgi:hypothetical protein